MADDFSFLIADGLCTKVPDGSNDFNGIWRDFTSGLGLLWQDAEVIAIHQTDLLNPQLDARLQLFTASSAAIALKTGLLGDQSIVRQLYYGGKQQEIYNILSYGFTEPKNYSDHEIYGKGIYLYPKEFTINSVLSAPEDGHGNRHVLLCSVVTGSMEVIAFNSTQDRPSQVQFDSGVDLTSKITRHIIWPAFMNSTILPTNVITFRIPPTHRGSWNFRNPDLLQHGISKTTLESVLAHYLPQSVFLNLQGLRLRCERGEISQEKYKDMILGLLGNELVDAVVSLCTRRGSLVRFLL